MIRFLRKNVFLPLDDLRTGEHRLRYLPEVSKILDASKNAIRHYQYSKIVTIIKHAYNTVPYYQDLYKKNGISPNDIKDLKDIEKLPILTKDVIRQHNDRLVSTAYEHIKDKLVKSGTGGTTSSPITLYMTRECVSKKVACTLFFYKWWHYSLGDKVVLLWQADLDFPKSKSFKAKIRDVIIGKNLMLKCTYLNDEIMWDYYKKIKKYNPKIMQAYPTPLYEFSRFMKKNKLSLCVKTVNVTAEPLYNYQRQLIEEIFGCNVFNWYGARELGHVATECHMHNGMHINTYGLHIEIVKNNKSVKGELGNIIVTDLLNDAMPLIRYEIGDMAELSYEPCSCGCALPLLKNLSGRILDNFFKKDGTIIPGVSFPNRVLKSCEGIKELQIIQKGYTSFVLNVVKGEKYCDKDLQQLKNILCSAMHEVQLDFVVNFMDTLPQEPSGKMRLCKCEIKDVNV